MKKRIVSVIAILLAALFLLAGCANHGKTLIKVGGEKISVNVYKLYLSRMRGSLAEGGHNVESDKFWNSYITMDQTVAEFYTEQVLEGLKQIAAALYLYDELDLKLSKDVEDDIDEWIDTLIEEVGNGSKSRLNSILAPYGANVTVLKDAALIEAKVAQLKEHLYGENGELISSQAKEEFYQMTYVRGYQMMISKTYYKHKKDGDGRSVYFQKDGKSIAYDKVNGFATEETDTNGDTVYRLKKEDGSFDEIAYDKENGQLVYILDDNGEYISVEYSSAELKERYETLEAIAEDCKDNPGRYLEYAKKWSDNSEFDAKYAPNGIYFSSEAYVTDVMFGSMSSALQELEEGELVILDSEYGYYLLMRVPLDEGAWQKEENSYWFTALTGLCMEYMLQQKTEEYMDEVKIKEKYLQGVDITTVSTNYRY